MTGSADTEMTLYLAFDGYLTARKIGLIIGYIDDVHSELSFGDYFRREGITFPDRARLRVGGAETGSSIQLLFQAGQQMTAELLGVGSVVVGGAGMIAATTALLVQAFSRIRIERQRAQLGAIAVEMERTKLEVERHRQGIQHIDIEYDLILKETIVGLAKVRGELGGRTPEQLAELAGKLVRPVSSLRQELDSGTLVRAAINGQDITSSPPPDQPSAIQ